MIPIVMSFGERFLFIDLGGSKEQKVPYLKEGNFIAIERNNQKIAVEIKKFRGRSVVKNLEQVIGQYMLYNLVLQSLEPDRLVYLAITDVDYDEIFSEPLGRLARTGIPLRLIVVDVETVEVKQWIT